MVGFVSDDLGDAAVGDSPGSCVEFEGPLGVPPVDALGPRLASEPAPLLGDEELLGPSELVPSA